MTALPTPPLPTEEFDREHLRLLTDKLSQKAEELRFANERLSELIDLGLQLGSELDPRRLLTSFCHATRSIIGARYAITAILDETGSGVRHLVTSGMDPETAARFGSPNPRQGVLRSVLNESRCLRLSNAGGDPVGAGFTASYPPIHSWLGAPIVSPTQVYGWVSFIDKIGAEAFTEEDERLARILAAQVGRIYQNGSLYADVLRHASELETEVSERKRAEQRQTVLLAVSQGLAVSATLREAAQSVLQAICNSMGWDVGSIWMVDRRTNVLRCIEVWQEPTARFPESLESRTRSLNARRVGLPGRVWHDGQPAWIPDITKDANVSRASVAAQEGLHAAFAFPILFEKQVLGVVEFFSSRFRELDQDLLQVFTGISGPLGQFMERKQAEEALRESSEQVRLLLDSTAEAIYGIDMDGNCTFANAACARLLGYADPRHLYGRNMHILMHHSRADGTPSPVDECRIYQAFQQGEGTHVEDEVLWRADGSSFPAEYWSYPIRHEGQIVGSVVTFLDITERKNLEDQFRHAQKMEAIGRLAGGVAHDFNNMLTVINGYGELVLGALPAGDPTREPIREMVAAGSRAASLTRQLLAFSRKAIIEPRVLDLKAVVADVDKMLRRILGEDIQLTATADPEAGMVKADPGQIEQVLLNLVVNARDAMPQGGRLTIEVRNADLDETYTREHPDAKPGAYVLVAVTDSGCGMDRATLAHIFEPFFSTKGERGTGLGLATVHGIVRQSGGHVAVYSEVGQGTTFKVYLPRVEQRPLLGKSHQGLTVMPRGSETVLLVEDEDAVRALSRHILQRSGYTVLEARDGVEAVRVASQHRDRIDLLVTDVVMPRLGGREVAERLAVLKPGVKVLFLSGYTDDAVVRHGILEAEVAFLQKPFSPASLSTKVREVLDQLDD